MLISSAVLVLWESVEGFSENPQETLCTTEPEDWHIVFLART